MSENAEISSISTITDSTAFRFLIAVVSSWLAETCLFPLEVTKIRLQTQSEGAAAKFGPNVLIEEQNPLDKVKKGFLETAIVLVREEGVFSLWTGLDPALKRAILYSGGRLMIYESLRSYLTESRTNFTALEAMLCATFSGAVTQFVSSPFDLVKIQMISEREKMKKGLPPRIINTSQALKLIYKENGFFGLWRGALPGVQRGAVVNIGSLAAYDISKTHLKNDLKMKEGISLHCSSAFCSGLTCAIMGTPMDVVKTRLMNQPVGTDGRGALYKGMLDCFIQSVRREGPLSLYNGFLPIWLRFGPWSVINWVAYESLIKMFGGKPF